MADKNIESKNFSVDLQKNFQNMFVFENNISFTCKCSSSSFIHQYLKQKNTFIMVKENIHNNCCMFFGK